MNKIVRSSLLEMEPFFYLFLQVKSKEKEMQTCSADGTEVGASVTLPRIWRHRCSLPATSAKTPASLAKRGFRKETHYPLLPPSGLSAYLPQSIFSLETSAHLLSIHLYHTRSSAHLHISIPLSLPHSHAPRSSSFPL